MAKKKVAGPAPKLLTTNRRNAIEAIKSSWNLQNIGDIFSECGERERRILYQVPGETNADFFEDATLSLMQQLAVITGDKVDAVRQRLKSRWRARTRGDADGKYEPIGLTAGSGDDGKNVSLRTDLQEFITEATAGTFAAHAKGKQTKAKTRETNHGEHEASPDDIGGDNTEGMTVEENVTEPEHVNLPSRRRRQRKGKMEVDPGVPSAQAIFVIRSAWSLPTASALFDILPENSYDPAIRSLVDPFEDSRHLMLATYKLALVTRGRVGEAKRALADAFMEEDGFDEEVATDIIRRLADRFANA